MPNEITPEATIIELNRCKVNGFMPVDVDRRGRAIERAKAALRKQVPIFSAEGFLGCWESIRKTHHF